MLTFFVLPTWRRHMLWGTTSNLMVRRDVAGDVRFSRKFPKHGGGEDIDFCLRVCSQEQKALQNRTQGGGASPVVEQREAQLHQVLSVGGGRLQTGAHARPIRIPRTFRP